jgi:hypothetical protein
LSVPKKAPARKVADKQSNKDTEPILKWWLFRTALLSQFPWACGDLDIVFNNYQLPE